MGREFSLNLLRVSLAFFMLSFQPSTGLHIKLYSGGNQKIFYEATFSSLQPCNSVDAWARNRATRFESDSCVFVHTEANCRGNGFKFEAGTHNLPSGYANSFRNCSPSGDGAKVRLALYAGTNLASQVAYFEDMCGCIELPDNMYNRIYSLNNYGSCVRLYDGNGCTADSFEVTGNPDVCSNNLNNCGGGSGARWPSKLRSLKACTTPVSCLELNLTATVSKITVTTDPTRAELRQASKMLPLAATKKYRNLGSDPISPEYSSSKSISTTNVVHIGTELSKMNLLRVGPSLEITVPDRLMFAKTELSSAIIAAYNFDLGPGQSERDKFSQTTQHEYSATERIEVLGCHEAEVDSHVKLVEGFDIDYEVEVEISGTRGGNRMEASELQAMLSPIYERTVDQYTIAAKESSKMKASFGIETFAVSKSSQIQNCFVGP